MHPRHCISKRRVEELLEELLDEEDELELLDELELEDDELELEEDHASPTAIQLRLK